MAASSAGTLGLIPGVGSHKYWTVLVAFLLIGIGFNFELHPRHTRTHSRGPRQFSLESVFGDLRSMRYRRLRNLLRVHVLMVVGKRDAVVPHVQFDRVGAKTGQDSCRSARCS